MTNIDRSMLAAVTGGAGAGKLIGLATRIGEWLGKGTRQVNTPKGAKQFISGDNQRKLRFDLAPGQHGKEGPHINFEDAARTPKNDHLFLKGSD
jgi:hypothetical protein